MTSWNLVLLFKSKLPLTTSMVVLKTGASDIIWRWKHTALTSRWGSVAVTSYLHTLHIHMHTLQHTLALFRDMGPFWQPPSWLGMVEMEGSKESKADPREGWGFCVCGVSHFITRETHNRPRKIFEALGGVCGNRHCGYLWCQLQYSDCRLFPGLGLCLSAERETVLGLYIREETS